uniref:contact-dependent growth inhibition system immunity protein n=1 Tax=Bordetella sputigena TaxID=1416810 RepID=UPI0039EE9075
MAVKFATARQMLSAYLNQDFDVIFGTADDAIRQFIAHSSPCEVATAIGDILAILAMRLSEPDLESLIVGKLGCCYTYLADWPSGDAWLEHIVKLLRS